VPEHLEHRLLAPLRRRERLILVAHGLPYVRFEQSLQHVAQFLSPLDTQVVGEALDRCRTAARDLARLAAEDLRHGLVRHAPAQ
jgi:hypothetical protein